MILTADVKMVLWSPCLNSRGLLVHDTSARALRRATSHPSKGHFAQHGFVVTMPKPPGKALHRATAHASKGAFAQVEPLASSASQELSAAPMPDACAPSAYELGLGKLQAVVALILSLLWQRVKVRCAMRRRGRAQHAGIARIDIGAWVALRLVVSVQDEHTRLRRGPRSALRLQHGSRRGCN